MLFDPQKSIHYLIDNTVLQNNNLDLIKIQWQRFNEETI